MKDKIGIYYYPYPQNKKVKMYVRMKNNDIEFRMRNEKDPEMWIKHGWVPREAIEQAKILYDSKSGFNPSLTYNTQLAKILIKETS